MPHHGVANAVGAAMAQVSGEVDHVFQGLSRDDLLAEAERMARERAVTAGADPTTLRLSMSKICRSLICPAMRFAPAYALLAKLANWPRDSAALSPGLDYFMENDPMHSNRIPLIVAWIQRYSVALQDD